MSQCLIYYPGLLGPDVPLEELADGEWPDSSDYPNLLTLFDKARAEALPHASVEQRLLNAFGISFPLEQDVPYARVRQQLGLQPSIVEKNIYCLDPVFVQVDQEEAVLLANESLDITESEARHLIEDLNQHFKDDGLVISYYRPHQWIMSSLLQLNTTPLGTVMQENINRHIPEGQDKNIWRRYINEIQMLLFSHPVNQQREQRGEATINSLWLWGGGQHLEQEAIIDQVFSNHDEVAELARYCDIRYRALPDKFTAMDDAKTTLYVFLDQINSIKQKDVYRWFDELKALELNILKPAILNIMNGNLEMLTIFSDTISLTVSKKALNKSRFRFWKKKQNFKKTILQARHSYAR